MSRSRRIPKHSHHKAGNRGVVRLNGHDHYTGPWGTLEAEAAYERFVAEWLANGRSLSRPAGPPAADQPSAGPLAGPTVADLVLAFWKHAQTHYRDLDGKPTSEIGNFRAALRPLRALYGSTPAAEFSPAKLKVVREALAATGMTRPEVNRRVGKVRHIFKWGVAEELVPVTVWQSLLALRGLQAGRCAAPEPTPVAPVTPDQAGSRPGKRVGNALSHPVELKKAE